jgi:hypothetical protein
MNDANQTTILINGHLVVLQPVHFAGYGFNQGFLLSGKGLQTDQGLKKLR